MNDNNDDVDDEMPELISSDDTSFTELYDEIFNEVLENAIRDYMNAMILSERYLTSSETFMNDSVQTTKMVSDTHRWFVEKILGEMPVAISSDRITTKRYGENDSHTSSSATMSSSASSDGTK